MRFTRGSDWKNLQRLSAAYWAPYLEKLYARQLPLQNRRGRRVILLVTQVDEQLFRTARQILADVFDLRFWKQLVTFAT
jgi:hypothetical protein